MAVIVALTWETLLLVGAIYVGSYGDVDTILYIPFATRELFFFTTIRGQRRREMAVRVQMVHEGRKCMDVTE